MRQHTTQATSPYTQPKAAAKRRAAAGFTLVEILISLGIFLIGMTAIVSLFPAAAILQRETTQEVLSNMAAESGQAIINAQSLTYAPGNPGTGDLAGYHALAGLNQTDVVPLRLAMNENIFNARFPFADRSYPTGLVDGIDIDDANLHWVPFIQDLNGDSAGTQNWIIRLFIVESDSRANYAGNANDANGNDPDNFPKVRGINVTGFPGNDTFTLAGGTDIEVSDIIMDSNGNDHVVTEVNGSNITVLNPIARFPAQPTAIWYTPRAGAPNSPAQRIITVEVRVENPNP